MKELLLVDDVKLYLKLTKSMVSQESYILHTAVNGYQALEIARSCRPDLILLDLHMPGMGGDAICRQIRSDPATRHIPVIMITSDTSDEARRRCLYAGCDDFISRPVGITALNYALERHLAVHDRAHERMDVVIPCLLDSERDLLITNIYTLSAGGAYVEIDTPPLPGSEHLLTFFLPEDREDISVRAKARWNRLDQGCHPAGSGFQFVDMGGESSQRLSLWVEDMLENPVFG